MTDPMQLLRAANPVPRCEAPELERLLARLDEEPTPPRAGNLPPADLSPGRWGRFFGLRSTKHPRGGAGRSGAGRSGAGRSMPGRSGPGRSMPVVLPVIVAVAVAVVALVSLHGVLGGRGGPHRGGGGGPARTSSSAGSVADAPGQARGRVVIGSVHPFSVPTSGAAGESWGAEWFQTTAGQICVQAGREVGGKLGYVDIDGVLPHDGRFHAWAPDTAVDARCIDRPARGGVALTVVERMAGSGEELPASGACTAAERRACPSREVTTLLYGVVGSSAVFVGYGSPSRNSRTATIPAGPGLDGGYIETSQTGGLGVTCTGTARCTRASVPTARLVHPGSRAFVMYAGDGHTCRLNGPGTDGVMSGDCPYGLTLGPSPLRLTEAAVRTRVEVSSRSTARQLIVTVRFRTRLPSDRIAGYSLELHAPASGCRSRNLPGGAEEVEIGPGGGFPAGHLLTVTGALPRCPTGGTYHGSIVVKPLVGPQLTVARFSVGAGHSG